MISSLYFKVSCFFVHCVCCSLNFVIVELSQFVQMSSDIREANAWIRMWKSDQEKKQGKYQYYISVFYTFTFSLIVSVNSLFLPVYFSVWVSFILTYILNYRFNGRLCVLMTDEPKCNCFLSVLASVNGGVIRTERVLWPRHCWAHDLD